MADGVDGGVGVAVKRHGARDWNTSAGVLGRNVGSRREIGHDQRQHCTRPVYAETQSSGGSWVGDENGQRALRILLADQDPGALKVTAGQVRELGHTPTEIAVSLSEAAEAIARDDPDLTIVVIYGDDEHALDLIEEIDAFSSGPVIALLDREDSRVRGAGRRARHLRLRAPGDRRVHPERHRDRHAPLARAARPDRAGRAPGERARAPRGHRARQGHPHGAPQPRRPRRPSSGCASTRAAPTARSSTWRPRWPRATRCCPRRAIRSIRPGPPGEPLASRIQGFGVVHPPEKEHFSDRHRHRHPRRGPRLLAVPRPRPAVHRRHHRRDPRPARRRGIGRLRNACRQAPGSPPAENRAPDRERVGRAPLHQVLVRAGKSFLAHQMTDRAATLTYYAMMSLFPALLVGVTLLGLVRAAGARHRRHQLPARPRRRQRHRQRRRAGSCRTWSTPRAARSGSRW